MGRDLVSRLLYSLTVANRLFARGFVAHRSQRYGVSRAHRAKPRPPISSRLAANKDPTRFVSPYLRTRTLVRLRGS